MSASVYDKILALDARYNGYRLPENPNARSLYLRRRMQLLRKKSKQCSDPTARGQYLRLRGELLSERCGVVQTSDGSARSRSLSIRSNSQLTLLESDFMNLNVAPKTSPKPIVPTILADASRALVGDTSVGDNYSFAGMHQIFEHHKKQITRLRFAHDERARLAIASADGALSICNIADAPGKSSVVVLLTGHTAGIMDFAWSISNDLIVSCSEDWTTRVWNPSSGECVRVVPNGNNCAVNCCAFQPLNNNHVVTGDQKGLVQVLNISTGKYLRMGSNKAGGAAFAMCCDNTGRILWLGDDRGCVTSFLIEATSGKLIRGKRIQVTGKGAVTSLCARAWVSREARDPCVLLNTTFTDASYSTSVPHSLCLYKVAASDGALEKLPRKTFPIKQRKQHLRSSFCPLMSFREGACVLAGGEDGAVYFFDITKQGHSCVNNLQGHQDPVIDVCFNHDESFLASGDTRGQVFIWKRVK